MERAVRWRGTRLLCSLSPGKVLPVNKGILQLTAAISLLLWTSHARHHTSSWSLQLGDKETGTNCLLSAPFFRRRDHHMQKCAATGSLTLYLLTTALQAEWQWLSRTSETITYLCLLLLQHQHLLHRLGTPSSTGEEFLSMMEIDDFHPVRNWSTLSCKIRQTHTVNRNILKWGRNFVAYPAADKLDFWGRSYRSFPQNKVWALILLLLE